MGEPLAHRVRARNLAPDSDNKIHDDDVAQQYGFTGALVPGVEVFAYATRPFAQAWGEEFLRRGRIDARFVKPVYDGDDVVVEPTRTGESAYEFRLVGPDGVVRATGHAGLDTTEPTVDVARFVDAAVDDPLPPADERSLAVGRVFGTAREQVEPKPHRDYCGGVGDDLPLYEAFVHPGALLRMVNAVLFRNVALGPWIHTGSSCRLLAPAPVPTELVARGTVTDRYERNGRQWVRFDALVLAGERPVMYADHFAIYDLGGAAG